MKFIRENSNVFVNLIVFIMGVAVMWTCFNYLKGTDQEFKSLSGIIRIIISLAAAAVSIALPGFIQIGEKKDMRSETEIKINKEFWNRLKAGGALAAFVLVYLFDPIN